jgi:alpha-amylase
VYRFKYFTTNRLNQNQLYNNDKIFKRTPVNPYHSCGLHNNSISLRKKNQEAPFVWEAASVYFLMTDRFYNGDKSNDTNFNRTKLRENYVVLKDIKGITKKIDEGYFDKLGINAIWFTPIVEQIHGAVDEGTGLSYPFHGYWARDWTALD